jgi:GT2 family glycosyltransferase
VSAGAPGTPDLAADPRAGAVTIVVMTRDRWPDLRRSLPLHDAPVVLVDNGSTDGTADLVRAHFPHVDVVALPENRGSVARTIGVRRARTPLVAFADDDSWWAPGALDRAARHFERHPRLGVLAARVLVGPDERPDPICAQLAGSPLGTEPDLPGPSVLGFLACGAVVRAEAYLAAGGFDDLIFFMGEEERLALDLMTLGWGVAYADDVVAHHHPSPVRDTTARQARAARNRLLTALLRRPWPVVLRAVGEDLRAGRAGWLAIGQALRVLPTALARRRVVPPEVERARRLLDRPSAPGAAGG